MSRLAGAMFPRALELWRKRRHLRSMARRDEFWREQQGREHMIHELQPGVRMRLYFDSELCRHIYVKDFEAEERHFMNLFLRPGDVFVDVGANIGLFTLIAAHLVGARGRIYSFEPCGATFRRLEDNVRLNGFPNVLCVHAALSDSAGEMEMTVSQAGFDAWNSFSQPYMGADFTRERVAMKTWDEFAQEHQLTGRVALMKIDVEGWEERVLRGMTRELARDDAPVLQVEFTDAAAQAAGLSCQSVYQNLQELGYEVCRFDFPSHRLIAEKMREKYPYCNLFAVKQRKLVQDCIDAAATDADAR